MPLTLDCHLKQRRPTWSDCENREKGRYLILFLTSTRTTWMVALLLMKVIPLKVSIIR